MKKTLTITILASMLLIGTHAFAQDGAGEGQKIVRVATLNSIKANNEFQRNVRLLRVQRERIIELKAQMDAAKDDAEKKKVKEEQDALLAKLNENNAKMFKTYGYSLLRNYTLVVEKAHIYMFVSNDEAAEIEKRNAEAAQ